TSPALHVASHHAECIALGENAHQGLVLGPALANEHAAHGALLHQLEHFANACGGRDANRLRRRSLRHGVGRQIQLDVHVPNLELQTLMRRSASVPSGELLPPRSTLNCTTLSSAIEPQLAKFSDSFAGNAVGAGASVARIFGRFAEDPSQIDPAL